MVFFYLYIDEWKFRRFVIWKMYVAVFMACLLGECVGSMMWSLVLIENLTKLFNSIIVNRRKGLETH